MKSRNHTQTETDGYLLLADEIVDINDLVIYNDDVNTFEFVIQTLVKLCGHEPVQAEQCAYIIHHNGKCAVKKGPFEKLAPICEALLNRGLSAKIE
jgi:ATP-dependent Clp protease adaptor protein ClpS